MWYYNTTKIFIYIHSFITRSMSTPTKKRSQRQRKSPNESTIQSILQVINNPESKQHKTHQQQLNPTIPPSRLKTTLPWVPADTKLSKLDTLRLASGYIAHLRALLADQPSEDLSSNGRPLNLVIYHMFESSNILSAFWAGLRFEICGFVL